MVRVKKPGGSQAEHDKIMNEIIVALNHTNLCRCWENKTGAAWRDGSIIHYGLKGSADILGIMRNGKFFGIEVKSGNATQSEQQKRFEKMVITFNGFYLVARDVTTALQWMIQRCGK